MIKNELAKMLNEHTSFTFMNTEYQSNDFQKYNDAVRFISDSGNHYGVLLISQDEDTLTFTTKSKQGVLNFTNMLDNNENVYGYDISVEYEHFWGGEAQKSPLVDFDTIGEKPFLKFVIDVVLEPAIVKYNDVYYDGQEDEETFAFEYETELDADEYEELPSDETPLLIKLTSEKLSKSPFGKINVTLHPHHKDKILIQFNYDEVPSSQDVKDDLDTLNDGIAFGETFIDNFVLEVPAIYVDGELNTTSAIYKATKEIDSLEIKDTFDEHLIESVSYAQERIDEVRRVIKVNAKGKRRIKIQCRPGFKYDSNRKACVMIGGSERAVSRIAHRQMARTKKAQGTSYKNRVVRKVKRAMRFRKMLGV